MRRLGLLLGSVAAISVLATLGMWFVVLAPEEPRAEAVSFDTLLSDVASGQVQMIEIRGSRYLYRARRPHAARKRAQGPVPTLDVVRKLRATTAPPVIEFDRF